MYIFSDKLYDKDEFDWLDQTKDYEFKIPVFFDFFTRQDYLDGVTPRGHTHDVHIDTEEIFLYVINDQGFREPVQMSDEERKDLINYFEPLTFTEAIEEATQYVFDK